MVSIIMGLALTIYASPEPAVENLKRQYARSNPCKVEGNGCILNIENYEGGNEIYNVVARRNGEDFPEDLGIISSRPVWTRELLIWEASLLCLGDHSLGTNARVWVHRIPWGKCWRGNVIALFIPRYRDAL
ncbi:hypothetical protein BM1_04692 [Bipolaris maydis]|nr:hypothetical protein BM1_04692 [Bipolaris maydis]